MSSRLFSTVANIVQAAFLFLSFGEVSADIDRHGVKVLLIVFSYSGLNFSISGSYA